MCRVGDISREGERQLLDPLSLHIHDKDHQSTNTLMAHFWAIANQICVTFNPNLLVLHLAHVKFKLQHLTIPFMFCSVNPCWHIFHAVG